jgi:hypothetical protein
MTRTALAAAAVLSTLALASPAWAQAAKPATPTAAAPAAPAKWVKPVKGTASIEVIRGQSKRVGNDMVTDLKIKNTSDGPIALLRVDEIWYDHKLKQVTGDSYSFHRPVNAGDVVDVTLKSPVKPDLYQSQYAFSHANGKVDAKQVKKFDAK